MTEQLTTLPIIELHPLYNYSKDYPIKEMRSHYSTFVNNLKYCIKRIYLNSIDSFVLLDLSPITYDKSFIKGHCDIVPLLRLNFKKQLYITTGYKTKTTEIVSLEKKIIVLKDFIYVLRIDSKLNLHKQNIRGLK